MGGLAEAIMAFTTGGMRGAASSIERQRQEERRQKEQKQRQFLATMHLLPKPQLAQALADMDERFKALPAQLAAIPTIEGGKSEAILRGGVYHPPGSPGRLAADEAATEEARSKRLTRLRALNENLLTPGQTQELEAEKFHRQEAIKSGLTTRRQLTVEDRKALNREKRAERKLERDLEVARARKTPVDQILTGLIEKRVLAGASEKDIIRDVARAKAEMSPQKIGTTRAIRKGTQWITEEFKGPDKGWVVKARAPLHKPGSAAGKDRVDFDSRDITKDVAKALEKKFESEFLIGDEAPAGVLTKKEILDALMPRILFLDELKKGGPLREEEQLLMNYILAMINSGVDSPPEEPIE